MFLVIEIFTKKHFQVLKIAKCGHHLNNMHYMYLNMVMEKQINH